MTKRSQKRELVGPWRSIHGAVWLIGLAILISQGWIWPGILVLIALSAALEGILLAVAPQAFEQEDQPAAPAMAAPPIPTAPAPAIHRADLLPSTCPKCGAPVRSQEVKWTGPQSADCSYCGANLPMSKT